MSTSTRHLVASAFALALIFISTSTASAAAGDPDVSFGNNGKVITQTGFDDRVNAMALQPDGKIVVAGRREQSGSGLVARYNADGSLDTTFGTAGFVNDHGHAGHSTYFHAVAVQPDGKIVVAGYFVEPGGCPGNRPWVVRYNSDGTRDTSFSDDGAAEWIFYCSGAGGAAVLYAIAIRGDGKILVAGKALMQAGNNDFAVARLNSNGILDTTFNLDGLATYAIGNGNEEVHAILQSATTSRAILVGYSYSSGTSNDFALAAIGSSGLFDIGFGSFGKVITDTGWDDRAYAAAFQPDGKLIAAGMQSNGATGVDFSLVRYNTNGSIDPTFGNGGFVKTAFGAYYDIAYGVKVQGDGKIVCAGTGRAWTDTSDNFAIARYNPSGSLDTLFSSDGKQTTDFNSNADAVGAVGIQADGKIVVAGSASNGTDYDIAITRYLP
jgi:uncharacterized delta-60 repeat protein